MLDQTAGTHFDADLCIIGSGAAGITLATELDGCGFKVLLLEAGTLGADPRFEEYYRGTANAPHPDPTQFRRVRFGGTTGVWGGRCVPYDPVDFEPREQVANSGWPLAYAELARHYPAALRYCDAGGFDFSVAGSLDTPAPVIAGFTGLDTDGNPLVMTDRIERYSLPTDFGSRYRERIRASANVTALLGARCLRLRRGAGAAPVEVAEVIDRAGRRRQVRARIFVLAAGGIEVPRLLLLSDATGAGLGNGGGCVGRYYMCHFENTLGRIVPHGAAVAFDFERTREGVYCRRQLRFTPQAMQQHRLLNMAFRLHFPSYSDAGHGSAVMSAIYLAKSALIPEYRDILAANAEQAPSPPAAHLRNVLGGLPQALRFGWDWLFRIRLARRKLPYTLVANADGTYPLEFNSEQTPLPDSRVTLADERDAHGLPRVRIDWRLSDADVEAACRGFLLLRNIMASSGTCRLQIDETHLRERIGRSPPLGGHHIGTARMATSERQGVVDTNCAVFGVPNLYVASSAVFPTSSHANPTLTIVAMSVRLAEHLRRQLEAGSNIYTQPSAQAGAS
ncbi:MAG: GMC family oxidoreductase [Steroidobacteraceae bacterium]